MSSERGSESEKALWRSIKLNIKYKSDGHIVFSDFTLQLTIVERQHVHEHLSLEDVEGHASRFEFNLNFIHVHRKQLSLLLQV